MIAHVLFACARPHGESDDSAPEPPVEAPEPPVIVLAGGGSEGDEGDRDAWSARLYPELWSGGDVTGDGRIEVAILADEPQSSWLPRYLEWLGADAATNVIVATRAEADDAVVLEPLTTADAVFVKGGDQGRYYDLWNDTGVEDGLRRIRDAGGGIGGTSAGAMSQAEFALAGSEDLVSLDVLTDSHTRYLDDASDGGSGIHRDFLGFVPGVFVDTHATQRGRLGRMAGVMAKAVDDFGLDRLTGIAIEEQTGVVVRGEHAAVLGVGGVVFLRAGDALPIRTPRQPLVWTDLPLDRLTDGASWNLTTGAATLAADAREAHWDGGSEALPAVWAVDGGRLADEGRFDVRCDRAPAPFACVPGATEPVLSGTIGLVDAQDSDLRGDVEELAFRALVDHPGHTALLVAEGGAIELADGALRFTGSGPGSPAATLVIATPAITAVGLAPEPSLWDDGSGALHAGAVTGATLHVLYTPVGGTFDPVARAVR